MSGVVGFLVVAAALGAVLAIRLLREPRRLSNGGYLVLAVVFLGLWGLTLDDPAGTAVLGWLLPLATLFAVVLAGFLVVNGLIMLSREWRRARNALSLAAGLAIVALLADFGARGGVGGVGGTNARLSSVVTGSAVLVAGYFGFVFTALLGYSLVYARIPVRRRHVAIVVLGASVRGSVVRPVLAYRLEHAKLLYDREIAAGRHPLLVMSGGQGVDEPESEAAVMARYLRDRGVPDSALVEESRSTSTRENLELSAAVLADRGVPGRILVVTNNFHVLRTAILSRRLNIPADVSGARTSPTYLPFGFLREFVALLAQYPTITVVSVCAVAATLPLLAFTT